MTEKEKYLKYIRGQKEKGLLGVHFTLNPNIDPDKVSEEDVYAELNRMIDAPDLSDPEILGRYDREK